MRRPDEPEITVEQIRAMTEEQLRNHIFSMTRDLHKAKGLVSALLCVQEAMITSLTNKKLLTREEIATETKRMATKLSAMSEEKQGLSGEVNTTDS